MSRQTDLDAVIDAGTAMLKWLAEHNGPDMSSGGNNLATGQFYKQVEAGIDAARRLRQDVDSPFMVRSYIRTR